MALTPTCQNILGFRLLLLDMPYEDFHQCTATTVFVDVDNAAAIQWAHNPIVSTKAKHLMLNILILRNFELNVMSIFSFT